MALNTVLLLLHLVEVADLRRVHVKSTKKAAATSAVISSHIWKEEFERHTFAPLSTKAPTTLAHSTHILETTIQNNGPTEEHTKTDQAFATVTTAQKPSQSRTTGTDLIELQSSSFLNDGTTPVLNDTTGSILNETTTLLDNATATEAVAVRKPDQYDGLTLDELEKIRFKAHNKYRKTRQLEFGSSGRRHWIWILFVLPATVLFMYVMFVVFKRQLHRKKRQGERHDLAYTRTPPPKHAPAKWNWPREKKTPPAGHEALSKEKFINRGPLVLTKELKGDVKFLGSHSTSQIKAVQFDDKLNEVVDIGTCVEVVPDDMSRTRTDRKDGSTNKRAVEVNTQGKGSSNNLEQEKRTMQPSSTQQDQDTDVDRRKKNTERGSTATATSKKTQATQ